MVCYFNFYYYLFANSGHNFIEIFGKKYPVDANSKIAVYDKDKICYACEISLKTKPISRATANCKGYKNFN